MKKIYLIMAWLLLAHGVSNATIRYVDSTATGANNGTSWANAYIYLSSAISAATAATTNDTIYIAKGTYYPTGAKSGTKRDSTFFMSRGGIKIYGGYPTGGGTRNITANPTIVSGDINITGTSTDNSYHVMVITGLAATADSVVVDGITVTAGNANGSGSFTYGTSLTPQDNGAGMHTALNNGNTRIALRNCSFSGNTASSGGGMCNDFSSPSITNCSFSGNTATYGGGMYNYSSSPGIANCTFSKNNTSYYGGGICNDSSSSSITNCTFSENTADVVGGGMFNKSSSPGITNCSFSGNTAGLFGGGILNYASLSSITNCSFSENTANYYGGGMCNQSASPGINNCSFSGNTATYGGGMCNIESSSPGITNCVFAGNTASGPQTAGGVDNNYNDDTTTITNCSFHNNTATGSGSAGGVMSSGSSAITNIANSIFWGNTGNTTALGGVGTYSSGTNNITYSDVQGIAPSGSNISTDPLFVSTTNLQLQATSPCINTGSNAAISGYSLDLGGNARICNTTVDMGAYEYQSNATIVYVDSTAGNDANTGTTWATAFKTLSYALNVSQQTTGIYSGVDSILVARGTYYPTGAKSGTKRDSTFFISRGGLKIYGGYPTGGGTRNVTANPTVASGDINTSGTTDNSYHVMIIAGLAATADSVVVDGITVSAGNANGSGSFTYGTTVIVQNNGAGMHAAANNGNIRMAFRNCTFSGNTASGSGGGMWNLGSAPTIANCMFSGNTATNGGAIVNNAATPTITNCTFSGNTASGGSGYGGAMYNYSSSPGIAHCSFLGNTATSGGGILNLSSSSTISNSIFTGNTATGGQTGGGIDNSGDTTTITNCSFYNNTATGSASAGGVLSYGSSTITNIVNSLFWGNTGNTTALGGVGTYSSGTNNITYSDVQGITASGTNISADPLFVSSSNLQLQLCSPATNAGINTAIMGYGTDLAGNTRIIQGKVDMGAYEYQGISPTNSTAVYVDSAAGSDANSGTSWAQAFKTLSFALAGAQACNINTITDSILVAKGTYYPTGVQTGTNRDSTFLIKRGGLKIYGGYPAGGGIRNIAANPTALSGAINTSSDADNSYHVMVIAGIGTAADSIVVDGVILTKGYATGTGSKTYNGLSVNRAYGGGISMLRDSTAQKTALRNCTFYVCNASYGGGASVEYASPYIFKTTFDSDSALSGGGGINIKANVAGWGNPVIDSCLFSNNHSPFGGGMRNETTASPMVTNCTFWGNTTPRISASSGRGAGMYNQASKPTIMNCTFSSNTAFDGGGMFNQASSPGITNCTFSGNTAPGSGGGTGGGGGMCNNGGSSPTLTNCVFSGNTAGGYGGGALNVSSSSPTVRNCTFSGNTAGGTGGLFNQASSAPTISNTIIFGNSSGVGNDASSTSVITYSLVQGITTGTGNINGSTDPLFVNPQPASAAPTTAGNYRLTPCSHVINVGRNDSIPAGITTDLAGNLRIYNTTVDMGAYELQSLPAIHTYDTLKTAICSGDSLLFNAKYYKTAVTHTDSFHTVAGCDSFKTLQLSINPRAGIPTVTTPIAYCLGATATALTATAGSSTDTLLWHTVLTGGAGSKTAPIPLTTPTGSTTYYVSGKTNLGCEGARTLLTVNVNPLATAPTITTPIAYCLGATATALTATAGGSTDTLLWYTAPSGGAGSKTAPTPLTTPAGSTTYYVSGKTGLGCEGARTPLTVVINPLPAIGGTLSACVGQTSALTGSASPDPTIPWASSSTGVATISNTGLVTAVSSGTTTITYKNTNGCTQTVTFTVNPLPPAPVVVSPIDLCNNAAATALTATGTSLLWYAAITGGTGIATAPVPNTALAGSTDYYVSQTNLGCEGPRTKITVSVHSLPTLSITPASGISDFVYCEGKSILLLATSPTAVSYQWKSGGLPIAGATNDTFSAGKKGYYAVTVTSVYRCSTTDSVLVKENYLPVPVLSPTDVQFCEGIDIMLYCSPVSTGYTYTWLKDGIPMGVATTADKTSVGLSGKYSVIVTDIFTCVRTTNISDVNTYPTWTKPFITRTGALLSLDKPYAKYQWFRNNKVIPGANSISYMMPFDGAYFAMVSDNYDCIKYSDTVEVNGLSVNNLQLNNALIKIYPNPTQNQITIEASIKVDIQLADMFGRILTAKADARQVDLGQFADGTYLLRISDQDGNYIGTEKIIKITQ